MVAVSGLGLSADLSPSLGSDLGIGQEMSQEIGPEMSQEIAQDIGQAAIDRPLDDLIQTQVSLAKLTSYRVGGLAERFAAPRTTTELQRCFEWADRHSAPVTVLGAGSNLLISDRGLPGLVLHTRHLRHTSLDRDRYQVTAGAGVSIPTLAWQMAKLGWAGLEWSVGVPGTVGGCVVMNAGAHGFEVKDSLVWAETIDPGQTDLRKLALEDLGYAYRTSNLQDSDRLVVSATFQLQADDPATVNARTKEHMERRHATQPYDLPSCGSVFRNPEPQKAAQLIETAGLKGYQIGAAQVSTKHANFIVNLGAAQAQDIYALIDHVRQTIYDRYDVALHPEVKMLGQF